MGMTLGYLPEKRKGDLRCLRTPEKRKGDLRCLGTGD
jgi:hypothetical protein